MSHRLVPKAFHPRMFPAGPNLVSFTHLFLSAGLLPESKGLNPTWTKAPEERPTAEQPQQSAVGTGPGGSWPGPTTLVFPAGIGVPPSRWVPSEGRTPFQCTTLKAEEGFAAGAECQRRVPPGTTRWEQLWCTRCKMLYFYSPRFAAAVGPGHLLRD